MNLLLAALCTAAMGKLTPESKTYVDSVEGNSPTHKVGCLLNFNGNIFDLHHLQKDAETQQSYRVLYEDKWGTNQLDFNICGPTRRLCDDELPDYANLLSANQTCTHLTTTVNPKHEHRDEPGVFSLLDANFPNAGLRLEYEGDSVCDVGRNKRFGVTVDLVCNPKVLEAIYALDIASLSDPCHPQIFLSSQHACATKEASILS
jgi:hypothetical protein